ncbi:MAG: hypothetical protein DHS20C16_14870 [Phycisphaerae bacterium]|nr:MAG: hypothetical protein DHS20C16_14870 [Phycisphaerae bacterium]
MPNDEGRKDTFDLIGQDGQIARTARMLTEDETLTNARKHDIVERVKDYAQRNEITLVQIAREIGISQSTVSEVLLRKYSGKADKHLRALNNWLELTVRRQNVIQNKKWVDTAVAREIVMVAELASETLCMAAVWGPARIGKSFTLEAIAGSDRLGSPILFRVTESCTKPTPFTRMLCEALELSISVTFDRLQSNIIKRLKGTKRMLMIDEVDRATYKTLELIRDIHDKTGCPILLAGKPTVYQRLGFRDTGDFCEVLDQLSGRIAFRRDLTERTRRRDNPEPLFSLKDIRRLIQISNLDLKVSREAEEWLQDRACMLGMGGFGKAVILLYLSYKLAKTKGDDEINVDHLDAVEELTLGHEDLERVEAKVAESSGTKIRRLG